MTLRPFHIAALLAALTQGAPASALAPTEQAFAEQTLQLHNDERAGVGLPPLQWCDELARKAERWATELGRRGIIEHEVGDGASGQGENLWMGSAQSYSIGEMFGAWADEKAMFRRAPLPDIHPEGRWADVGHYSQIVWHSTSRVGCALARTGQWDVLVCRYDPPGNRWGEAPF